RLNYAPGCYFSVYSETDITKGFVLATFPHLHAGRSNQTELRPRVLFFRLQRNGYYKGVCPGDLPASTCGTF
ncbi:MAG: hypothetical protein ABIN18_19760, partial [Pseudomonadota bacterium]